MKSRRFPRPAVVFLAVALVLTRSPLVSGAVPPKGSKTASKTTAKGSTKDKASSADGAVERELLKATKKVDGIYLKDLEGVASWGIANGLKEKTAGLIAKMKKLDPAYPAIEKLEARLASAKSPPDASKAAEFEKSFDRRVDDVGERYASKLFELATGCMRYGLFTRAFELVKAVLAANPDHRKARETLSYAWDAESKSWITKWTAEQKKKFFVTPEGWVKKESRKKWDEGLRDYEGKWISKEEEKRIRERNNYNPYAAYSEHFEVKTLLGRGRAFDYAMLLEDFYEEFFEFYLGFYDQTVGAKLFFNRAKLKKKHLVVLFPSRVAYLEFVKAEKGNDELLVRSGGFWSEGDRTSFFYWTDDSEETLSTLYHEVTHQLFGETKESRGGSAGNVWIVEGIASYMETWEKREGRWHPGWKIDSPRIVGVQKFLEANPGWTLPAYLALGHKEFHEPAQRGLNYAMGAALCHFFIHYDDEVYREALIRLISDYYGGKLRADSLAEYIPVEGASSPAEKISVLEKQFKEYMANLKRPGGESVAATDAGRKVEG